MLSSLKTKTRYALNVAIAFTPWLISMYLLFWLEHGGIWMNETAHRGKISVAILAAGMVLSFLFQSHFAERKQN